MKLLSGVLALALLTLVSCGSTPKKKAQQQEKTQTETVTASHIGTFEGTLPAADCDGIKTTLQLEADGTYSLQSEFDLNGETQNIETNGVYHLVGEKVIELVVPSSNEKIYYKIVQDGVMLSDEKGTENQGELAASYILKRK